MNQSEIQLLFALLRSSISGSLLTEEEKTVFTDETLFKMAKMAKVHDLIHLLAIGINKVFTGSNGAFENEIQKAIFRYERTKYELDKLCEAFEKAEIDFMPLKGPIISKYYPEPWMRTSCDIDILVKESDLNRAAELLIKNEGYTYDAKGSHNISLFSANKSHFELHYTLIEDGVANSSAQVLNTVWETSFVKDGKKYWHEMPDEMFYFYHIAHMAKHFEQGGCGIRTLLDLWILDNMDSELQIKRDELLKKGGLLKFAMSARLLKKVWFEKAEHTVITKQMEDYILRGGVYGTSENALAIQQQKKGGRVKYALSKVFIPYERIKLYYPILEKHPWLTPVMEVRRWFKIAFCGQARSSIKELQHNNNISRQEAEQIQVFLENIGL
ncbi:MAG: hypothetical protein E7387_03630 [Ruminococcaceae bacterium]|nr:hypothetical protein [Oscillospiraceae bacterium]